MTPGGLQLDLCLSDVDHCECECDFTVTAKAYVFPQTLVFRRSIQRSSGIWVYANEVTCAENIEVGR